MADAFAERFGPRIREMLVSRGGHPLPDDESFAAGARALQLADESKARGETLVVLLSGGASAMLAAPAPGVTLEDKIALTRELLRSGMPIAEMNAVRKRMSAIKGGKLAAARRTIGHVRDLGRARANRRRSGRDRFGSDGWRPTIARRYVRSHWIAARRHGRRRRRGATSRL